MHDAVKLDVLRRARVVAGAAGLDRSIRSVNIMEVPDILPWVKPDELLLTTAYPLRDQQVTLVDLVPKLAEKGLAGLAIKPDRYITAIPPAMIEAAERLSFPLIELPPETSFDDVINAVLSAILNRQALRLERSAAIHERFTQIVLGGGGLREIARTLSELLGRAVVVADPSGMILDQVTTDGLGKRVLTGTPWDVSSSRIESGLQLVTIVGEDGRSLPGAIQPVQVGTELLAVMIVLGGIDGLGEEDMVAIEQAAIVAALRLVQARAVAEADRRFRAICLEELITGHIADRGILHERAVSFNWNLAATRAVMVAELEEIGRQQFTDLIGMPGQAQALRQLAFTAGVTLGHDAIVWEQTVGIAALLESHGDGEGLTEMVSRFQMEAQRQVPHAVLSIGIGRPRDNPLHLHESYAEARQALAVGRQAQGPGHISFFFKLGIERLLSSCPPDELRIFWDATIGPLAAYDRIHRTELVRTVETLFSCNQNVALAARLLYVHYNTLRHRIERIEDIIGPCINDPDRCLHLALALRVRRLLASGSGPLVPS